MLKKMDEKVTNEDCMAMMARYPDNFFELAIVDPPYGIGANKEKPHNGWQDWGIKHWDNAPPSEYYFQELLRVSKNQIIWGANHFIEHINRNSSCWVLWDKGQRDFSLADGELAWTSFNKAMRIYSYSRAKALQEGKIHPTQKPVALYRWLLQNYAKPGDKILDTHLGSQSSRIAAFDLGFEFYGTELDEDYFREGCERFERHANQGRLFLPEPQPVQQNPLFV
jgi:site-specific DNA-methyltransferase (adenine-specific)